MYGVLKYIIHNQREQEEMNGNKYKKMRRLDKP
jgi:predicted nucleotidyltransferase